MLVWDFIRTSLARWYIIVAGLILTVAGSYFVYQNASVSYQATASVVLIPPKDSVVIGDNPYLYLGGLDQALGVVAVRMSSSEVSIPLAERFPGAAFTIAKDATTTGPIMAIGVTGNDATRTLTLLDTVVGLVPQQLSELQSTLDVPAGSRISSLTLAQDNQPAVLTKDRTRAVLVVGAAGATMTLLFTAALDKLLVRRREKHAGKPPAAEGSRRRRGSEGNAPENSAATGGRTDFAHTDDAGPHQQGSTAENSEAPQRGAGMPVRM